MRVCLASVFVLLYTQTKRHTPEIIMRTYQTTKQYHDDRLFGCSQESLLLPSIQNRFGGGFTISPTRYSTFDFSSPSGDVVELKTRRCKKDRYPDTMIGANKIQHMLNNSGRSYCVFSFTDGAYFVEVTPDSVAKFRRGSGGRCDRGQVEQQMYYFIPVNLLCPLEESSDDM